MIPAARILAVVALAALGLATTSCVPHVYAGVDVPGPFVGLGHVSIDPDIQLGGRIL